MVRPTASNFGRIITPKTGKLSAQHRDYACELVAKQMGVWVDSPPSFWMERGIELEPSAIAAYEVDKGVSVDRVGFVLPDDTDAFGGSPDGLVGDDGLLEIKCPKPERVIRYHGDGTLPDDYRAQVQGLLLITDREWCDFVAWHPEMQPFVIRVEPDRKYQALMRAALDEFTDALVSLRDSVSAAGVHIIKWGE